MNSQEPDPGDRPPKWFEKWWADEKKRRAKQELKNVGRDIFMIGLSVLAVGLTLATVPGVDETGTLQIIGVGATALIIGLLLVVLSPWAAVREGHK